MDTLLWVGIAAWVGLIIYYIRQQPPPAFLGQDAIWISSDEFGLIERDLSGLIEVVVVLNKLQAPNRFILDAVIDNFTEDVRYTFLVSARNFDQAKHEILPTFHKMEELAAALSKGSVPNKVADVTARLTKVFNLGFEWDDHPYVFYRYQHPDDSSNTSIMCFRGDVAGEGIGKRYRRVEPENAFTILRTALHNVKMFDTLRWAVEVSPKEFSQYLSGNDVAVRSSRTLYGSTVAQLDEWRNRKLKKELS